jgi:hypothetical protein
LSTAVQTARAETFIVDLPELVGQYSMGAGEATAQFDLGTTLQSIQSVEMGWAGTIIPGVGHGDGIERPIDEYFDWPGTFGSLMNYPSSGFHWCETTTSDESFDLEQSFTPGPGGANWDFLLDGQADVLIRFEPGAVFGGVMVAPPTGELTDAYLVIEAVVPEPQTLGLLVVAALPFFRCRRA